ncbi:MAG: class I SAM-dependent methyltransferase [Nitrospinaceae bacterium]|jgi:SAM-dependent methyltransferase|nr:class I SAM-dependent methyltransferase [Nitrospinaceae bacterium]MBT3433816.1 class I SAM-dependent methyltransferase [Nitrospinaceae bacterium]MBT3821371.1 class I SAM-dependent methyltransferase [Nitrospinaceae bacterium]MBT4431678.1 class I SAM-dependent methyltransferase [Nitrospinaceae bacterium]MBT5369090.1 class I SAM-dependent methyltransferase [Nitrospinaceae bacterium]
MRLDCLGNLLSPATGHELELKPGAEIENDKLKSGELADASAGAVFPVRNFIPRFAGDKNYAATFGYQWEAFQRTQIDSVTGLTVCRDRFFGHSSWPEKMAGETILEVGCGAGRYADVVLGTGAVLYSTDMSSAVDVCLENNGHHPNHTVIQADMRALPFPEKMFDRIFCFGVLQHTPDPKAAFVGLLSYLKPGGVLSVDCYHKDGVIAPWKSKYLWRWLATRMPVDTLHKVVKWYVPKWMPVDRFIAKIPYLRRYLRCVVPCFVHDGFGLDEKQAVEWAVLDTFDALSAAHDHPQTVDTVRSWFEEAGMKNIEVRGGPIVVGNGQMAGGEFDKR